MAMPLIDPECLSVVEAYSGNDDPQAWLAHLQAVADLYLWDEALCIKIGMLQLRGAAQLWARRQHFAHWVDFCQQLTQRFGETTESAAVLLEQCFQQHDESPHAFADRFLCCAVKAGRCEDPALLYSFTQRLLPELREEALRQRLHSIADVAAFCDYWVTTQSGFDTWQQYGSYDAVHQQWDLPDDFVSAAYEQQEHDLHLFQECPAADDIAHLYSMCASLERQLLQMQQRDQECQHAQDIEIHALMAALAEQDLRQHKQQSSVHAFDAACDPANAFGDDYSLELLACTHVAEVPAAGLPAANLATQQPMSCHAYADACEHPVPTCCDTPDSVSASPEVTLPYSSGCTPPTTVPTMGCNSSSLAPETPKTPSRHGRVNLQVKPSTHDEPSPIEELSSCPQHSSPLKLGMHYEPCDYYYNMPAFDDCPDVASSLLQVTTTLSPASIQDCGGTSSWLQVSPKPHPGIIVDYPTWSRHLRHMLAWSKLPKDPGKPSVLPDQGSAYLAFLL
jgi:hypothetical protein